jgi:hypothetical protein
MNDEPLDEPVNTELPSLPARIAQVFFSPGALFAALRARPVWLGALITLAVISLAANTFIPEELIRQLVMERLGENPEQAQIDAAMRMAGFFRYIGPVVFTPVLAVVLAALVLLIWNLVLGGEASFKQAMSVTTHVLFIPTLGSLFTIPLMIAANDARVSLGLHLLLPGLDDESYVYRLFRGLNLFSLWAAVVLGIGVSRLNPKVSFGSAAGVMLTLYVAFKAVTVGLFG